MLMSIRTVQNLRRRGITYENRVVVSVSDVSALELNEMVELPNSEGGLRRVPP